MRPYIFFAANTLRLFLTDPKHVHQIAIKHFLKYPKGTIHYGLKYDANQKFNLDDYVDSEWAGSVADRKSTLG